MNFCLVQFKPILTSTIMYSNSGRKVPRMHSNSFYVRITLLFDKLVIDNYSL